MDDILGKLDENGSVAEWPKFNVKGGNYTPPNNRITISSTAFVVLPAGFTEWELIEQIKSGLTKPASKTKAERGSE